VQPLCSHHCEIDACNMMCNTPSSAVMMHRVSPEASSRAQWIWWVTYVNANCIWTDVVLTSEHCPNLHSPQIIRSSNERLGARRAQLRQTICLVNAAWQCCAMGYDKGAVLTVTPLPRCTSGMALTKPACSKRYA